MEKAKNPKIVKKPAVSETLRQMNPGEAWFFDAASFASLGTVQSVISRLNADGRNYTYSTTDNGMTYEVHRIS